MKLIIIIKLGGGMEDQKVMFDRYLKSKNLKLTEQRLLILEAVFDLHIHFTVESLYDYMKIQYKDKSSEVSIPTIYRTLPLLMESGLIRKADSSREKDSYEHIYGHLNHVHITCKLCDKLIEEEDTEGLFKEIIKITNKYGFQIDDFSLSIRGECGECQKK